jgi:hypothetical protein
LNVITVFPTFTVKVEPSNNPEKVPLTADVAWLLRMVKTVPNAGMTDNEVTTSFPASVTFPVLLVVISPIAGVVVLPPIWIVTVPDELAVKLPLTASTLPAPRVKLPELLKFPLVVNVWPPRTLKLPWLVFRPQMFVKVEF